MNYFDDLHAALGCVEVTNEGGMKIQIEDAMNRAHDAVIGLRDAGAKVIFIGNGGSAAIASHMACDWLKNGKFNALSFNDGAMLTCITNDIGFDDVFSLPISHFGNPDDMLVAISSSGKSKDILKAVDVARQRGLSVMTLSGFLPDNPLRESGDMNFYVRSDKYGHVEIAHLAICHALLDGAMPV